MKRTTKKVTLQTLDKKIDVLGQTLDKKIGDLTETVDGLARSTKHGFDAAIDFQKEMTEFAQKTALTLFAVDSKLQIS